MARRVPRAPTRRAWWASAALVICVCVQPNSADHPAENVESTTTVTTTVPEASSVAAVALDYGIGFDNGNSFGKGMPGNNGNGNAFGHDTQPTGPVTPTTPVAPPVPPDHEDLPLPRWTPEQSARLSQYDASYWNAVLNSSFSCPDGRFLTPGSNESGSNISQCSDGYTPAAIPVGTDIVRPHTPHPTPHPTRPPTRPLAHTHTFLSTVHRSLVDVGHFINLASFFA
jgi:hypothetical protein